MADRTSGVENRSRFFCVFRVISVPSVFSKLGLG